LQTTLVGLPAVERRAKECGIPRPAAQRLVLDSTGIRSVVAEAKELFEDVLSGFRGSRVSQHRLALLISEAECNVDAIDHGSREVEVISVMQLKRCSDVFARWRLDPLYDALIRASKNPPKLLHNQLVLEIAGMFADSAAGTLAGGSGAGSITIAMSQSEPGKVAPTARYVPSEATGRSRSSLVMVTTTTDPRALADGPGRRRVSTLAGGRLADRVGRRAILVGCMAVLTPLILLVLAAGSFETFLLLAAVGFFTIGNFSVTVVLGQGFLPNRIGVAAGITLGTAIGIGGITAALLGLLADAAGLTAVMVVIAALPLGGLVCALAIARGERPS
jgi:hypothetical protein